VVLIKVLKLNLSYYT